MKYGFRLFCILALGVIGMMSASAKDTAAAKGRRPVEAKLGWRLAVQAWSFNQATFYETIDKVSALGLHYLEAYPGQKLSQEHPEVQFNHFLSPQDQAEVLARLKKAHIKLVNYGVIELGADEAANRQVFEFAKKMGIETIVSEPTPENLAKVDKLCQAYQINVAIHNHPKPNSPYWNPEVLAKALQGRSARIGACADTGHWVRSGVDPVQALGLLKGRIISLHFKDLDKRAPDGGDMPWGSGQSDAMGMLEALHQQGFQGVFSAEFELADQSKNQPEIAQSILFFRQAAATILKASGPAAGAKRAEGGARSTE